MRSATKVLAVGMGSTLAIAGAAAGVAVADMSPQQAATDAVVAATEDVAADLVQEDEVVGSFSFTQDEVSSNEWIYRHIGEGAKYLCGSEAVPTDEVLDAADWVLEVTGDVDAPFAATIGALVETNEIQSVFMGCSCAGNPADGLSVANALVEGVSAKLLVALASPSPDANTVVFTSADGYEVALPLDYVATHYCPLVFNVNGSALVESVGGTNQLWLGSTPASYFVRDVVSIRLETRDEVPADPVSDEARAAYGNLPNVGVKFGGEVA